MSDKQRTDFRLIVAADKPDVTFGPYLKVHASVCYMTPDRQLRNPTYYGLDSADSAHYEDLQVTAQADTTSADFYGWEVEYRNVYRVTATEARRMAATLTRIQRRLDSLSARYGYPESFGAYLARVADVIGVAGYGFGTHDSGPLSVDGYKWHNANGIGFWVADRLKDFHKQYGPPAGSEV